MMTIVQMELCAAIIVAVVVVGWVIGVWWGLHNGDNTRE
jgi:hypothetical protein